MNKVKLSLFLLLAVQGLSLYGVGREESFVAIFKKEGKDFWRRNDDSIAVLINASPDDLYEFDDIAPILADAIRTKRLDVVEMFGSFHECDGILDYPLNNHDQTALMLAAGTGQIYIVKYLDGKNVTHSLTDTQGKTALDYAKKYREAVGKEVCYNYLSNR